MVTIICLRLVAGRENEEECDQGWKTRSSVLPHGAGGGWLGSGESSILNSWPWALPTLGITVSVSPPNKEMEGRRGSCLAQVHLFGGGVRDLISHPELCPCSTASPRTAGAEARAGGRSRGCEQRAGGTAKGLWGTGTGAWILGPVPVLFSLGPGSLAEEGQRSTLSCWASPQKGPFKGGSLHLLPCVVPLGQAILRDLVIRAEASHSQKINVARNCTHRR